MNQEQNNFNVSNFNAQGNNGIPNNQPLNSNPVVSYDSQTGQPIYGNQSQQQVVNKPIKKKKYWLIPVFIFIAMILAPIINITLRLVGVGSSIIGSISTIIYVLCGLAFIPSIIFAIVLSCKNK